MSDATCPIRDGHYSFDQLHDSVYSEWSETDLARLDQHLESCPWCRTRYGQVVPLTPKDRLNPADLSPRYQLPSAVEWRTGGQGRVCRATHIELKQPVALKIVRADRPLASSQLRAEGRVLARLHHPNIIAIYDLLEWGGHACLAMEFVEGQHLAEWSPLFEKTRIKEAVTLIIELIRGVEYAHHQQIWHLDVKPRNVLLDHGRPRLLDFGLSWEQSGNSLERRGGAGTPRFMAPEQMATEQGPIDHRTDIYGLAATLFTLVTSQAPFAKVPEHDLGRAVLEESPSFPPEAKVPRDLEAVIRKGMATRSADRYPTATAFREELERFQKVEPVLARRQWLTRRAGLWVRRHPEGAAVMALLLLIATASLGALVGVDWLFNRTVTALADQVTFLARRNPGPEERLEALGGVEDFNGVLRKYAPRQQAVRRLTTAAGITRASMLIELGRTSEATAELDRVEAELQLNGDEETTERYRPALTLVRANAAVKSHQTAKAAGILEDFLSGNADRPAGRAEELLIGKLMIELQRAARTPEDRAAIAAVTRRYLESPAPDDFSVATDRCEVLHLAALREFPRGDRALGQARIRAAAALADEWVARRPNDPEAVTLAWRMSAMAAWHLTGTDDPASDSYTATAKRLAPRANRAADPLADMTVLAKSSLLLLARNEPPPADALAVVSRLESIAAESPSELNVTLLALGYSLLELRAEMNADALSAGFWRRRAVETARTPPGGDPNRHDLGTNAVHRAVQVVREKRNQRHRDAAGITAAFNDSESTLVTDLLLRAKLLTLLLKRHKGEPTTGSRYDTLDRHLVLTLLEAAELAGFNNADKLEKDKDFADVRHEPRFQQILYRLRMPPPKK